MLAGPGSGKTRVIVERFLRLIERGVPAERQLVLTYTNKAAEEMRERVERVLGPGQGAAQLSTFHAFAQRVLREWGWRIQVPPSFRIADDAERWLHLEAVLAAQRPRTLYNPLRPHDLVDPLLHLIGTAKQELVTPQRYREWAAGRLVEEHDPELRALLERHAECAAAYAGLDVRYRTGAVLDHDDCILLVEQLLREDPAVRTGVGGRLSHVMVDEYQDTNHAQARLMEALVAHHRNLLVVADDDQSIYKFRGASLANLERFRSLYTPYETVTLGINYRSTPEIVAAGRAIIAQAAATSRISKRLTAHRSAGAAVEVWEGADERAEATAVAVEVARLLEVGEHTPRQLAWLFRRHAHMEAAMDSLREAGVPYQVRGGRGYFQQPEVKDLLALLAVISDPTDTQALLRCLHLPAWEVSSRGRRALVAASERGDDPPLELLVTAGKVPLEPADAAAAGRCVAALLELAGRAARDDVRELVQDALDASAFLGMLGHQQELARLQMGANLNKFAELLENFADWSDDRRPATALRYLTVLRDSGAAAELPPVDASIEGIELLTAHSAKGLEWPVVFLGGCVESRWPGLGGFPQRLTLPDALVEEAAPGGDRVVDEERRLFYVAASRARDRLVLTRARRYRTSYSDEKPSPFLLAITAADPAMTVRVLPPAPPRSGRRLRAAAPVPPGRLRVSVSDLHAFRECPRRYEYRVRYRMPRLDTLQGWFGNLIHDVLHAAAVMRAAGEPGDAAAVIPLYHRGWDQGRRPRGATSELRAHGEEQLRRYLGSQAWRSADIVAAEHSFVVPLDHGDLQGRFDRLDRQHGVPTVVDYKTGPPKDADQAQRDLQVRAYAVAVSQRDAADRVGVELHSLQTGEVTRVDADRTLLDRWYRQLSATTAEVGNAWRTGNFPPTAAAYRCRRCEYRTVCDEGRRTAGADRA